MGSNSLEELYPNTCRRLAQWGEWSHDTEGLGYPRMSIEQMAIEGGGIDTRGSGLKRIEQPPGVDEVEAVMTELKQRHQKHFLCIKHYFESDFATIDTMRFKAGYKRKERTKAAEALRMAVAWVDGRLNR